MSQRLFVLKLSLFFLLQLSHLSSVLTQRFLSPEEFERGLQQPSVEITTLPTALYKPIAAPTESPNRNNYVDTQPVEYNSNVEQSPVEQSVRGSFNDNPASNPFFKQQQVYNTPVQVPVQQQVYNTPIQVPVQQQVYNTPVQVNQPNIIRHTYYTKFPATSISNLPPEIQQLIQQQINPNIRQTSNSNSNQYTYKYSWHSSSDNGNIPQGQVKTYYQSSSGPSHTSYTSRSGYKSVSTLGADGQWHTQTQSW